MIFMSKMIHNCSSIQRIHWIHTSYWFKRNKNKTRQTTKTPSSDFGTLIETPGVLFTKESFEIVILIYSRKQSPSGRTWKKFDIWKVWNKKKRKKKKRNQFLNINPNSFPVIPREKKRHYQWKENCKKKNHFLGQFEWGRGKLLGMFNLASKIDPILKYW